MLIEQKTKQKKNRWFCFDKWNADSFDKNDSYNAIILNIFQLVWYQKG